MLVVIGLGGNALLRRGEPLDAATQRANIAVAAAAVAEVVHHHRVVLTHGNGPQVGLLALQAEADPTVAPYPLDVLGAETEGMIGYLLEQELAHHVPRERLVTVLTQVLVDPADPAFGQPTKFIGPAYSHAEGEAIAAQRGWTVAQDGATWRRVVASPEPREIVEINAIKALLEKGLTVLCAGGGGIPIVSDGLGGSRGVEAVIDKDLSSALLATAIGADALVLLTDVDAVYENFGQPDQRRIRAASPAQLRDLALPTGSMGPKVEALCRFVEAGGAMAAVGSLPNAAAVVAGISGTVCRASADPLNALR